MCIRDSCYRSSLFAKLLREIERYYREITDGSESIQAAYIPSWEEHDPEKTETFVLGKEDALDTMRVSLKDGREEERRRRHAVIGPNADRIEFFIEGKNARIYGSQGQQLSLIHILTMMMAIPQSPPPASPPSRL